MTVNSDNVAFRRAEIVLFLGLLIYIAQIPWAPLQVVFGVMVALYLAIELFRNAGRTIRLVARPRGYFLVALTVYALYVIFALRQSVHQDATPLYKALLYGLPHLLFFFALQIYGAASKENAVRLVRVFVVVLMLSFLVYVIGLIYPIHLFAIRYLLYSSIFDQLEREGLLGIGVMSWSAGLAPYLYVFGYQVAAGAALALSLLMTAKRDRVIWAVLTLLSFVIVIVVAQRSVLPALAIGLVVILLLKQGGGGGFRSFITNARHLVALIATISIASAISAAVMAEYYADNDVLLVQERVVSEDLWTRLGMQLAAMEIIATHPLGLVAEGRAEEDWGGLAEGLGYDVVPDANQVDFALVHNAYLRIVMYLGWWSGALMIVFFVYLMKEALRFRRHVRPRSPSDGEIGRYGVVATAVFVSLLVQAMFHNDSIFTFERTSWISLCILLVTYRHINKSTP
jgi:hypothetical protein